MKSERFAGFSGSKKEQSEPFTGLFYNWENITHDRIIGLLSDKIV